jgi:hypothetical protein
LNDKLGKTYDCVVAALANVLLLSTLFPNVIPVLFLDLKTDNAEFDDTDTDGGVLGDRNRVVVECNNLVFGFKVVGINPDDEVLDNLRKGIIFA